MIETALYDFLKKASHQPKLPRVPTWNDWLAAKTRQDQLNMEAVWFSISADCRYPLSEQRAAGTLKHSAYKAALGVQWSHSTGRNERGDGEEYTGERADRNL